MSASQNTEEKSKRDSPQPRANTGQKVNLPNQRHDVTMQDFLQERIWHNATGLGQDDEDDGGGGGGDCHSDGCVMMVMRVSLVQWIWVTGQQWVVLSECGGLYKHNGVF